MGSFVGCGCLGRQAPEDVDVEYPATPPTPVYQVVSSINSSLSCDTQPCLILAVAAPPPPPHQILPPPWPPVVPDFLRRDDVAALSGADTLMAQAYAKDWKIGRSGLY